MPRRGNKRKKKRTEKEEEASEREKRVPRCFVLKRGRVGDRVRDLVRDFREVMMPNCAKSLRESRLNRLEDFIAVAGQLHVTHLIVFTATKVATYMKLTKLPQGPTLTFKVTSFSLASDVRASQRRPRGGARDYTVAPLQVLDGFGGSGPGSKGGDQGHAGERQLTAEMLRGLFPPIHVPTFNQSECRRAALFQSDRGDGVVHFRHFSVYRKPVGLQRGVSKLLRTTRLPKLGRRDDIADFVLDGGGASESEVEEGEEVPSSGGGSGRVAVRLTETGPRLTLLLVKAEEGVNGGGVLYHRYQTRTPSQQEVLEQRARQRRKLRERNARVEARADKGKNAERKRRKELKALQTDGDGGSEAEEEEGGLGGSRRAPRASGGAGEPAKKKRFHPFGWGAKATRAAAKGEERTVNMDDRPGKKARSGGDKAWGAAGDRGPPKREQQRQERILDRFHRSGTKPA